MNRETKGHEPSRPVRVHGNQLAVAVTGALLLVGTARCTTSTHQPGRAERPDSPADSSGDTKMALKIESTAFAHGRAIPKKYTGDGDDVSPELHWSKVPEGTQQFALICDDPDAPTPQPWVHWIIYRIPADVRALPEAVAPTATLETPAGAVQGTNSWPRGQTLGYRGPAPPPGHGVHHYHFKLYAVDAPLKLAPGADKPALLKAMEGHILGQAELVGTYQR